MIAKQKHDFTFTDKEERKRERKIFKKKEETGIKTQVKERKKEERICCFCLARGMQLISAKVIYLLH